MTFDEMLRAAYRWSDSNAMVLLLVLGLAFPAAAVLLSWIGRGGRTDRDGRFFASLFIGVAAAVLFAALLGVFIATSLYDASLLRAPVALLAAPLLCFALTLLGIRWIFPLNQLASARTLADLGLLLLLCGGLIWFFSKFRGWGIVFFGGILQLVVLLAVVLYFMRRVFRRAFGLDPRDPPAA